MTWFLNGGHAYVTFAMMVVLPLVHWSLSSQRTVRYLAELILMYSLGVAGFKAIFGGFVMHFFFADMLAESIGWPAGNPFQTEVAFANLALGVVGALCFFRRDFWLPVIIAGTIFSVGAGITHLMDIAHSGNFAPNNAGAILYADFLIPIMRIALYAYVRPNTAQIAPA